MSQQLALARAQTTNLELAQQLARAQATAGETQNQSRMVKIADPDRFDGARSQLRAFKAAVENKITGNSPSSPTVGTELAYIFGLLKGRVQDQIEAQRLPNGSLPFASRQDMIRVLDQAFGDPDEEGTAQRRLMEVRQANRTFADYFAEFQRYAPLSGFNPKALKSCLERGLSFELEAELHAVDAESMTLEELAIKCQQIDNRMRRGRPTPVSRAATTATSVAIRPTQPLPAPVARPLPPGEPMDLSAAQTQARGPRPAYGCRKSPPPRREPLFVLRWPRPPAA